MASVEVTPVGSWRNAIYCTVKDLRTNTTHQDVPLAKKCPQTDSETFYIPWRKLPIVIMNEMDPMPDHDQMITDDLPRVNVDLIDKNTNPADVLLTKNIGWPTGVVVLEI